MPGGNSDSSGRPDPEVRDVVALYRSVDAQDVNGWLVDLLPEDPGCVLDVGAGSGRDSAWLAGLGHHVVAVEPDARMRTAIELGYPSRRFDLLADRLPGLDATFRTGLSFDLILANAVWMFVPERQRERAFRKLVTLLKPKGVLAITLRAPIEPDRGMHPVSTEEIERLARRHGAFVERADEVPDALGRRGITWIRLAVRLPDDGAGALPLVRRIVLGDEKSSTYKLALLRSICRIAHCAPGMALEGEEHVDLPLGLVALFWLRLYLPLLRRDFPQSPINVEGFHRLGFARKALGSLEDLSPLDLRPGFRVAGERRAALHQALADACRTIADMPATHLTFAGGAPVFPVVRRSFRAPGAPAFDRRYLAGFGTLSVPAHLWRAMQRYAVWIEPALIEEWTAMTMKYGERQSRTLDESSVRHAMQWREPERDVGDVRRRVTALIDEGTPLYCVWTGKRLGTRGLDIDHCFPWSAWPCGDLWNLMPSTRQVNQREKRDLLPDDATLRASRDRIVEWWGAGYLKDAPLSERFFLEARARLPVVGPADDADDVFSAMGLQRLRLSSDQQVPEWDGARDPVA